MSIAVPAQKGREIRVRAYREGWSKLDLAVYRDPAAPRADVAVTLSRGGAEELMCALQAVLDVLDTRRDAWLEAPEGRAWLADRATGEAEDLAA